MCGNYLLRHDEDDVYDPLLLSRAVFVFDPTDTTLTLFREGTTAAEIWLVLHHTALPPKVSPHNTSEGTPRGQTGDARRVDFPSGLLAQIRSADEAAFEEALRSVASVAPPYKVKLKVI